MPPNDEQGPLLAKMFFLALFAFFFCWAKSHSHYGQAFGFEFDHDSLHPLVRRIVD